ncbi:MAG: hypothetical protein V7L31_26135 [Nostoc sp.]|uniref:hypothetical protein n=1 Tax=Nostoc sp. TaxID=1180 RepID=UPI002FF3E804
MDLRSDRMNLRFDRMDLCSGRMDLCSGRTDLCSDRMDLCSDRMDLCFAPICPDFIVELRSHQCSISPITRFVPAYRREFREKGDNTVKVTVETPAVSHAPKLHLRPQSTANF